MPLLRRTMRRAREGRSPTWPSTISTWSFSTGWLGSAAAVRVMYASTLWSRRRFEIGFLRLESPREQRPQQPLQQQADRHDGEDHRHEIDAEQHHQRQARERARLAAESDDARPD